MGYLTPEELASLDPDTIDDPTAGSGGGGGGMPDWLKGMGGGAGTGAAIGSIIPGVGTGVGAAVGAGLGGLFSLFGGGPSQTEQVDLATKKLGLEQLKLEAAARNRMYERMHGPVDPQFAQAMRPQYGPEYRLSRPGAMPAPAAPAAPPNLDSMYAGIRRNRPDPETPTDFPPAAQPPDTEPPDNEQPAQPAPRPPARGAKRRK